MKKLFSIFLSLVMLLSMTTGLNVTVNAETSGDFEYTVLEDGTAKITGYNGTATELTIPDTIDGYSVTSIDDYAFYDCTSLTSVTIPNSVTSIGNWAFECVKNIVYNGTATYDENDENWGANVRNGYVDGNLVYSDSTKTVLEGCGGSATGEIVIPDTVAKIDEYAFYDCSKVEKVTIPDSVTSIGDDAFFRCTSLTSVTIGNGVTSIGGCAFYYCTSITSVTIPDSVTNIGVSAFYCVKNIVYNGTETGSPWGANALNGYVDGNLVYEDSAKTVLEGCGGSATGEVVIPDTVTKIDDNAFYNCTKIEKVTIPYSVTSIGSWAFAYCTSLTSVIIPNSVTSIGDGAFGDCTSLTSVTIPDSVTSIGSDAFSGCTSLTSVTIPDSVTSIGSSAFLNVKNIVYNGTATGSPWGANARNGYVDGNLVYSDSTKTVLEGCGGSASGEIVIPDTVTKIDDRAFYYCEKIEKVTIPDSVTSIGDEAFDDCSSLKDVYYGGSEADWNNIAIGYFNSDLTNATIHYNSTGPTTDVPTTSTHPVTPPATSGNTSNVTTTPQTNAPAVNNVVPTTTTATTAVVTTATPTTVATTTTTATTEAAPAGAKKVDGVWVNSKYKKTSIKKLKKAKKSFKVTFKKVSGVKGYQVQYSTSKKFTKKTTKSATVKGNKAKNPSKTIKKLKSKKTYYVRVRTYKTVKLNGKNVKVYSKWSKVKSVKTK